MSPEIAARHILELTVLEGLSTTSTAVAPHFQEGPWKPENFAAGLRYGYLRGWFRLSWDRFEVTEPGREAAYSGMLSGVQAARIAREYSLGIR